MDRERGIIGVNQIFKINPASVEGKPFARSGHRAVADERHMWIIGGYNPVRQDFPLFKEMWRMNLTTFEWEQIFCKGHMPDEVASHSMILDGRQILVFGGTDFPFGEASSNKVRVCNLVTNTWRELNCVGNVPEEKYGQAMVIHKQNLFVFGGTTGYYYNADVHKLNLHTLNWNKVIPNNDQSEIPHERYRHEIALFNNSIFILGGGQSTSVNSLKILHSFNCDTNRWTRHTTTQDSSQNSGYPAARRCHGCVQIEHEAFISGGYDGFHIMDDIWKINLNTLQWTKLAKMPEPVFFHSATVTPDGCMFIFGGVSRIEPGQRTNSCYRIWLKLPSLQTLCWHNLIDAFPQLLKLPRNKLLQMGVTRHLLEKLQCSDGA